MPLVVRGSAPGREQDHGAGVELVLLSDGAADGRHDVSVANGPAALGGRVPGDLHRPGRLGDDAQLRAVAVEEGGDEVGGDRRVGRGDGGLDVARVVVAAVDDDQVVAAAEDVELAVVDEADVAGAQDRAVEPGRRRLRLGPVAGRDAGGRRPDLAAVPGRGRCAGGRGRRW
ncbi:hypothetical protein GCM10020218_045220 [Dactylosporangium vinaceum]